MVRTVAAIPKVLFHGCGRRPIVDISPEPGVLLADLVVLQVSVLVKWVT